MGPETAGPGIGLGAERLLGVNPDASAEEVDAAWRSFAKRHHPDRGGDPEVFRRGMAAREQLRRDATSRVRTRGVPSRRRIMRRRVRSLFARIIPSLQPPPSRVD
ncbi:MULTISPECIES: J domain-containing protein [Candidatus Microthrix]|uniref:J domain-containing protein n=1 Tax=Candidatus Neomicrothrix parvicella RN1 TaxID=1229780 RepID=R4Z2K4_9ACTN|nr:MULTISPECIES: DnaJ domain-containing protein [Microthrix]NLH65522.1 DnaJ domain-containing protein [Candidatus Microthrix parvicella]MBK6502869.1 DnaJ domain-containing protein [Candidatus Microthrix sp.]MBK7021326.1 DnaJ domain-containing protein [Candidatus Microthrix sp.]MBK7324338.1 DnaJ domain-containing protein [Candidatus Microthrix sp.]MBL0204978.1 DnaJ domain-containing protein [Candidatus Microthrix sp.]